jgi:hypothetical protein
MGYDYHPCTRKKLPKKYNGVELCYRANISGHHWLRMLLHVLGQDTTLVAVSNDGLRVPKKVAIAWGKAILDALDKNIICEKIEKSNSIWNGSSVPYIYKPPRSKKQAFLDALDSTNNRIDEGTKEWLRGLATMFILSGGFRQW